MRKHQEDCNTHEMQGARFKTSKSAYGCHKQNVGLGGQGNEQDNFNKKKLSGVRVANEGHKKKKIDEFVPKAKAKMTTSMTLATFMKVESLNKQLVYRGVF